MSNMYLTKLFTLLTAVGFVAVTVVACGGDDDDGSGYPDAGSSFGKGTGGRKTTGSGGSTATNTGGTAGSTAPITCTTITSCDGIECGTEGLAGGTGILAGFMCVEACCTSNNQCGSSFKITANVGALGGIFGMGTQQPTTGTCVAQRQPGTETASCPKFFDAFNQGDDAGGATQIPANLTSMIDQYNYKGCCRSDGTCGYFVPTLDLGCASAADVNGMLPFMNMLGIGTTTATPKACTP